MTKEFRVPLSLTTANAVAAGCAGIGFLALLPAQPSALQATVVMTAVAGAFSTVLLWGANRAAVTPRVSAPPATLHNPLTGLATPALADVVLGTEFAAAQRGRPLSILLVRVEQAREYEARHGAPMRERLLRAAARTVAAHTRGMNLSAHHRSDDATFLLILSEVPVEGACIFAKRLRRELQSMHGLPACPVVSAAVASYDHDQMGAGDLLARAERALQKAGTAGGRIIVHGRLQSAEA